MKEKSCKEKIMELLESMSENQLIFFYTFISNVLGKTE